MDIHELIPGGAHTYSKGDDQFPSNAPKYIKYGKGAYIWGNDNIKYLDTAMGLTSVSLGHAYRPVLDYVIQEIGKGSNFQRPSYLEAEMAEKFLELIPQHQMIKFAKNGSTATTAAVKLSRAFTGRKLVAFPYDHPFYSYDDWFIVTTPCNKGVPEEFASLSVTYKADDINSLKQLFLEFPNQIACVISEPETDENLSKDYLNQAIDLAHEHGALYIMDEMITGFKTDFPGSISKYNVTPDLATWGKGIANGFAFSALTGTREVMELGGIKNVGQEKVFLTSTTHGAETSGMAACIATIQEFAVNNVIEHNHMIGRSIHRRCNEIIQSFNLQEYISVNSCDWWPKFTFRNENGESSLPFKTLFMQEMISNGVITTGTFVPCYSHTLEDVNLFCDSFEKTLGIYKEAIQNGISGYLIGESIKPVFRKII